MLKQIYMVHNEMIAEPLFWSQAFEEPKSPTELEVVPIKAQLASRLNEIWHSRLPKIHWSNIVRNRNYICYAAKKDGVYIACGIWSSPVNQNFDFDTYLELRRLAVSDYCPKNTATWMIAKMVKDIKTRLPKIEHLISYQDTEVHLGTIYKAANWRVDAETKFNSWGNSRNRSKDQSKADKIRWAYDLV